jgi:hypothetical protein
MFAVRGRRAAGESACDPIQVTISFKPNSKGATCAAIGFSRTVTVSLAQPAGNRVLIDSNGAAIPAG